MSLGELLKARVLDPLGMGDTGFRVPAEKRGRLAALYRAPHPGQGGGLKDVPHDTAGVPEAQLPGASELNGSARAIQT